MTPRLPTIPILLVAASCAGSTGRAGTAEVAVPEAQAPADVSPDGPRPEPSSAAESAPSIDEGPAPAVECVWVAPSRSGPGVPTFVVDGGRYIHRVQGLPCTQMSVRIRTAEQVAMGTQLAEEAARALGQDNVRVEFGVLPPIYTSREELLADPDAGPAATALLPSAFDFANNVVVRYEVLHSRQVGCRDAMLRLTAAQARARAAEGQKWRRRAERLAKQWIFVPDAASRVLDVHLIDPVLPAERAAPPSGPCTERWISQPALTAVPRDGVVRLLER